jgi:predicted GH43/DUF377 family glycosyl hydrolase
MSALVLKRLGLIMEPEAGNPQEVEGVLNPGAARGPDGKLYLFPRLTAKGNYSRIGIARVKFDEAGDPVGVERLGIALEPEADYEKRPNGGGGCEDARVTFVEPLKCYVMTYTAFSSQGPRIAAATSLDLFHWKRIGLASFGRYKGAELDDVDDKDASLFPVAIPNPSGTLELALVHRPLFPGTRPEETVFCPNTRELDIDRESIWISYCAMGSGSELDHLGTFACHHRLATPVAPWERLKIGGGTPPILAKHGWLIIYHGVHEIGDSNQARHKLCYSAGVMLLNKDHPHVIRYRSTEPALKPTMPQERDGTVANVVFPTGIDRRDDLGAPNRFDVYYGMADSRIGAARLDMPDVLPPGGAADPPEARV